EPKVNLWDPFAGQLAAPTLAHESAVLAMAFSPSGEQVATGSADGNVRLWEARSGMLIHTLSQGAAVHSIAYRRDGKLLAAANQSGMVHFWDPDSGQTGPPAIQLKAAAYHVAFSNDGRLVVTADAGNVAQVWEVATGKAVTEPLEHQDHRTVDEFAIA